MVSDFSFTDEKLKFLTLNYAVRILLSEIDFDKIVPLALETIGEFASSSHIEMVIVERDKHCGEIIGVLSDGEVRRVKEKLEWRDTPLMECLERKQPGHYVTPAGLNRLVLPLVGSGNTVIGLMLIELDLESKLDEGSLQVLIMLSSLIAVSLLHTRYFNLAMYDGLTGLYVRRMFDEKLSEELNRLRRYGGNLSVIMADIDHFKRFNDSYGHQIGDMVLQQASALLRDDVREGIDIPCRYGGEELVVILPNTDLTGAVMVAERFRRHCELHHFPGPQEPLHVTFSLGAASTSKETLVPPRELVRRVDEMLYQAKREGRNLVKAWQ